jgi:hypothetical protein
MLSGPELSAETWIPMPAEHAFAGDAHCAGHGKALAPS